jgi:hypothetical protein
MSTPPDIEQQKKLWLGEHLPYQVMMMRHTYSRMFDRELCAHDWNAMYMAFAVASRNLVQFFTNKDRSTTNFGAQDFVAAGFGASSKSIETPMKLVRAQILHLDKARPSEQSAKFQLESAQSVVQWVEKTLKDFRQKLSPDDQNLWNDALAPERYGGLTLKVADAPRGACTASPQIASLMIVPSPPDGPK